MATPWIPLLASAMLEPNEVVQVFVSGAEVAVWRSAAGHVQVWENRCPHRSVRLSLGRVEGESLICAYHGWRFAAANAACQHIPAQPTQRAPASLCAKAYSVRVQDCMIWFAGLGSTPVNEIGKSTVSDVPAAQDHLFCGSVVIHADMADISAVLLKQGFIGSEDTNGPAYRWQNMSATPDLRIYITPHNIQQATLHMLLSPMTANTELAADLQQARLNAMQQLYSMRDVIEDQYVHTAAKDGVPQPC